MNEQRHAAAVVGWRIPFHGFQIAARTVGQRAPTRARD